jgi:hypothetical protein
MLSDSALMWTRVFAGIFLFLVANFAYGIWLQIKKRRGGRSWPVVQGEIIASDVEQARTHGSDDDSDCSAGVRYRYQVGAKTYEGHRIRFGSGGHTTRLQAEELIGKYPVGARIPVHYNSQKPSESVLEPEEASTVAALTMMLISFSLVAPVLVAHGIAGKVLTTDAGVPLWTFIGPLAAIGAGVIGIGAYLNLRRERLTSLRWPTVTGTITRSEVATEIDVSRDDKGHETTEELFRASLQFAYRVGEREFHSSHWNWGWTSLHSDRSRAEAVIAKYPIGKKLAVYYNPAQPETAVLEPGDKSGVAAPLWAGIVFIAAGAIFLWGMTNLQMVGPSGG